MHTLTSKTYNFKLEAKQILFLCTFKTIETNMVVSFPIVHICKLLCFDRGGTLYTRHTVWQSLDISPPPWEVQIRHKLYFSLILSGVHRVSVTASPILRFHYCNFNNHVSSLITTKSSNRIRFTTIYQSNYKLQTSRLMKFRTFFVKEFQEFLDLKSFKCQIYSYSLRAEFTQPTTPCWEICTPTLEWMKEGLYEWMNGRKNAWMNGMHMHKMLSHDRNMKLSKLCQAHFCLRILTGWKVY